VACELITGQQFFFKKKISVEFVAHGGLIWTYLDPQFSENGVEHA
jgi:hypothetical protein